MQFSAALGGKAFRVGMDQSGARPTVYGWQSNVLCSTHRQRPSGPGMIASCRTAGPAGRVAPPPTHRGAARQGISSHARTTTPLGEAQAAVTFSFFFFLQIPSTPVSPERETGLLLAVRFSMRVKIGCNGFGRNRRPKTDLLEGLFHRAGLGMATVVQIFRRLEVLKELKTIPQ